MLEWHITLSIESGSLGGIIADNGASRVANDGVVLALVFAPGQRPDSGDLLQFAQTPGDGPRFSISHCPEASAGWLELLISGMTFDLRGLAPAAAPPVPGPGTLLGLDAYPRGEVLELLPGPHLAEGRAMLPVIRALATLGAGLSVLPGVDAVCWLPSGAWMEPDYFRRIVAGWLGGGAFPALGLTTLQNDAAGYMRSRGLSLFSGQELLLEPQADLPIARVGRLALRLIHELVGQPAVTAPIELAGPDGEAVHLAPENDGAIVRVTVNPAR